nr:glycosyltransferase [uncultured Brevundimonas sp.]
MRVLIVNTLYPPADIGGAERSVAQLAEGLAAAGVETSVLTLSPGDAAVEHTAGGRGRPSAAVEEPVLAL